jgi:DNA repair exonuclease SbcCD nuclease subunit
LTRTPLCVLHTADLHLDGHGADGHRERERLVFQRIAGRVLADRVDLLLIAVDLFDHTRASDETVAFVRRELDRRRQPVVILPGNHDCLYANGVYASHDFSADAPHVHDRALDGEMVEFPELDAVVWGRGMAEHELAFPPLAHIPARNPRRWSFAMDHGFLYEERPQPERSSPIFAEEIRDTGWAYVALGHHHRAGIDGTQARLTEPPCSALPPSRTIETPSRPVLAFRPPRTG